MMEERGFSRLAGGCVVGPEWVSANPFMLNRSLNVLIDTDVLELLLFSPAEFVVNLEAAPATARQ
jgi:hypothetical protein